MGSSSRCSSNRSRGLFLKDKLFLIVYYYVIFMGTTLCGFDHFHEAFVLVLLPCSPVQHFLKTHYSLDYSALNWKGNERKQHERETEEGKIDWLRGRERAEAVAVVVVVVVVVTVRRQWWPLWRRRPLLSTQLRPSFCTCQGFSKVCLLFLVGCHLRLNFRISICTEPVYYNFDQLYSIQYRGCPNIIIQKLVQKGTIKNKNTHIM